MKRMDGTYEEALEWRVSALREALETIITTECDANIKLIATNALAVDDENREISKTPKTCLTDGSEVTLDHKDINSDTGQQKAYVVLCPEERKKGYVRPLRRNYKHVGQSPKYPLRDLTPEEIERQKEYGYVKFEEYPESESPKTGRLWTQAALNKKGCGTVTTMGPALAETYARKPDFYGGTFCVGCGKHFPVEEFVWEGTDEQVGS